MRLPELNLADKIKLILDAELLNQIDYAHNKVGKTEWSGFLLYKQEEGDFETPSSIVLKAYKFFPLDIGTPGHTQFRMTPEAMEDLENAYPDYAEYKLGLIHTHHTMSTFFSGEDMNELHDNTANYPYYLSLIVNFEGKYAAKVAFIAKETDSFLETNSFLNNIKIPLTRGEKDHLVLIDCNIVKDRVEYNPGTILTEKWTKLQETKYVNNYSSYNSYGTQTEIGFNRERFGKTTEYFPREYEQKSNEKTFEETKNSAGKKEIEIFWKEQKGMMLPLIHPVNIERIICKIALLDPNYKNRDYMHQLRTAQNKLVDNFSRDKYFTDVLDIIEDCIDEELSWASHCDLTVDEICYACTKLVSYLKDPLLSSYQIAQDLINLIISYCNELYTDEIAEKAVKNTFNKQNFN